MAWGGIMKISADWIVYHLRSFNYCVDVHNTTIGATVKQVLEEMGCHQIEVPNRNKVPLQPRKEEDAGMGFAQSGYIYDIDVARLPEAFRKLSQALNFPLD
jgi:hypothetical protein